MNSTTDDKRDVFIIYTKGDPYEAKLVEAIKDRLYMWGLACWVYEDWDWEKTTDIGPRFRSYGTQLDPVRYAMHHPEPFAHRVRGSEPDRETLAWMFEQCGAIILIAPRSGSSSAGTAIELEVLERNPHCAVISVSWRGEENRQIEDVPVFFNYEIPSVWPRDFNVASESVARAAWLGCMMERLAECGPMGLHLFRELARNDSLLNRIARLSLRAITIPFAPDSHRVTVPEAATAEKCRPVLELWLGGPGYASEQLTSGKPPTDIIEASKCMRYVLHAWCEDVQEKFPELQTPSAKISLPLGATKLRIGKLTEAIEELNRALDAPDCGKLRTAILLDRGMAWQERGFPGKAISDYTEVLQDETIDAATRQAVLLNRGIVWSEAGKRDHAKRDLDEILSSRPLGARIEAQALISRALLKRAEKPDEAIADYDRILALKKAPSEARVKALLNRGALQATLGLHDAAMTDYDAVIEMRESSPEQVARAFFNRAYSKSETGDLEGARADYQTALEHAGTDAHMRDEIERRLAALQ